VPQLGAPIVRNSGAGSSAAWVASNVSFDGLLDRARTNVWIGNSEARIDKGLQLVVVIAAADMLARASR
jgi:hypothetical protein